MVMPNDPDVHERGYWISLNATETHNCDELLCIALIEHYKKLGIKSAIDIGCGNGAYTRMIIKSGINCIGYDGSPYTPYVSQGLCYVKDFSEPVNVGQFDLVLSFEVGEHLPKQYEQNFINNLCRASKKYICLSWAVEGQPGIGHWNCQNNDYIINELKKRGFFYDKEASEQFRLFSTLLWFKNTLMLFKRNDMKKMLDLFKGAESTMVTVVLTSCGRLDYLKRTIETFNKFNTFPIAEFIIIEDSGSKPMYREIKSLYPNYTILFNEQNIGLVKSIDRGYGAVKTDFVMHLEDDWEFTKPGFIEKSLEILLAYPKIMQVWLRAPNDTNGQPVSNEIYYAGGDTSFLLMETSADGTWHGFTWNPGLRRLSDYKLVAPFNDISPDTKAGYTEMYVGIAYHKLGLRAAILREGYCFHIGIAPKNYSLV